MTKYIVTALALTVSVFIILAIFAFQPRDETASPPQKVDLTFMRWEVADTDDERRVGLSHRIKLAEDEGMIFVFDRPGIYPFWMKETLIPLDIVWLRNGRVVDVATLMPPYADALIETHVPLKAADTVLEMRAGQASELGIGLGTLIRIK